jgi:Protein of unknown function (DUF4031)
MTILVDDLLWWWRERRWCHLVSNVSLAELHEFAVSAGLPARAFHGDHYDIPDDLRPAVVALGAVEVSSRDLLKELKASGLRLSPDERRRRSVDQPEPPTTGPGDTGREATIAVGPRPGN